MSFNQACISKPTSNPIEADLQILQEGRIKFHNNPLLGYLNINSLRNKVTYLRIIFKGLSLDYFVLSETKLDESFPIAQFTLERYEIRSRKNRDKYGGGLIEFVKTGFICKTIPEYTSDKIECIFSEFTISKSKWICFSIYRPPVSSNLTTFFEELTKVVSKAVLKYENIPSRWNSPCRGEGAYSLSSSNQCINKWSSSERCCYVR